MDIKQLLQLARIKVGAGEQKELEKELGSILGYVDKLKEINVDEIEEMTHALDIYNEMREDKLPREQYLYQGDLVNVAPYKKENFVRVKKVFENED